MYCMRILLVINNNTVLEHSSDNAYFHVGEHLNIIGEGNFVVSKIEKKIIKAEKLYTVTTRVYLQNS